MATMDFSDDDSIYNCEICCKKFEHPNKLYYCTHGHFFCQNCFKEEEFHKDKRQSCLRKYCKSLLYRMDNRGLFENILQTLNARKMFSDVKTDDTAPVPSFCGLVKNYVLIAQESSTTLSKRPVNCPYPGCRKTVAVSSVNEHFRYEHTLIASINTRYEVRNELKINPSYLETNQPTCIILINILDEKYSSSNEKSPIKPIFLVMASNIMNIQFNDLEDEDYSEDTEAYFQFDKAIFWIASNIITKSKYTLALSTICKTIRVKYYGLLSQINDNCLKLSEGGKGLILHEMQILKMTNSGKMPLSLDFIIHKEEMNNI